MVISNTILSLYGTRKVSGYKTKKEMVYKLYTSVGSIRLEAIHINTLEGWAKELNISIEEAQKLIL